MNAKKNLFFLIAFSCVATFSCSEIPTDPTVDPVTEKSLDDGSGDGFILNKLDNKPTFENAAVSPGDYELTYNSSTGTWYGSLGGSTVGFYGPSPSVLQSGGLSVWTINSSYTTPSFSVSGDGSDFTVTSPGCSSGGSAEITMYRIKKTGGKYVWEETTRTIKTFSGTDCTLSVSGKIVLNGQCKPTIVTSDSQSINSCTPTAIPGPQFFIGGFSQDGVDFLLTVADGSSTSGSITSVSTIEDGLSQDIALTDFSGTYVKQGGVYSVNLTIYSLGISYSGPSL